MKRTDLVKRIAPAVLAAGLVGAVAVAPAAAAPVADYRPPSVASSWVDLLPPQLNCLLSTGWAAFCLGVPLL
ncbi:hypothetical protein AB0I30_05115 [Nocardia tengchongensis]|uniref:hypothetical protein n=1 Tax=Nocardia tengchongensis TaxID=2055889 RepID=UPI0033D53526